jgi:hypothetical protein
LPPNPATTVGAVETGVVPQLGAALKDPDVGAPNPELLPKLLGAGELKPPELPKPPD